MSKEMQTAQAECVAARTLRANGRFDALNAPFGYADMQRLF